MSERQTQLGVVSMTYRPKMIYLSSKIDTIEALAITTMRYYILSKQLSGEDFAGAVRNHWGIENWSSPGEVGAQEVW